MIRDCIGNQINSGILFDGTYGIEIETECKEFYNTPNMKFWTGKGDGSLRDVGVEYILKVPLRYGDELRDGLGEFRDKTKGIPFIQDSNSTSVHVHINMLPESWKTMANFLTVYTLIETVLMEVSGEFRKHNLFCLPIPSVPYVISIMKEIFANVHRKNYRLLSKQLGNEREQNAIKYAALNLGTLYRFGSVEIRSFRGVTDVDVIYSWVSIINRILEYARHDVSPNEIMDLYQKKNLRLIKDIFQDDYNLIKYDNMKELIEPNLWYAGDFGYVYSKEQWNKMDQIVNKNKINIKRDPAHLDKLAKELFGWHFKDLEPFDQDIVIEAYNADPPVIQDPQLQPQPVNLEMNNEALNIQLPAIDWEELEARVGHQEQPEIQQPAPRRRRINLNDPRNE